MKIPTVLPAMALISLVFAAPAVENLKLEYVNLTATDALNENNGLAPRETTAASYDFYFRAYRYSKTCDHNSPPGDTIPYNNQGPHHAISGTCYSSPAGWSQSIELDRKARYIQVFCDAHCTGRDYRTIDPVRTCFNGPDGCAVGSFLQRNP